MWYDLSHIYFGEITRITDSNVIVKEGEYLTDKSRKHLHHKREVVLWNKENYLKALEMLNDFRVYKNEAIKKIRETLGHSTSVSGF